MLHGLKLESVVVKLPHPFVTKILPQTMNTTFVPQTSLYIIAHAIVHTLLLYDFFPPTMQDASSECAQLVEGSQVQESRDE
jgi:hypothetical protein